MFSDLLFCKSIHFQTGCFVMLEVKCTTTVIDTTCSGTAFQTRLSPVLHVSFLPQPKYRCAGNGMPIIHASISLQPQHKLLSLYAWQECRKQWSNFLQCFLTPACISVFALSELTGKQGSTYYCETYLHEGFDSNDSHFKWTTRLRLENYQRKIKF